MHRILVASLAASLCLAGCAPKESAVTSPVEQTASAVVQPFIGDLQVHTYELPNGLTLKVVPDASAPVVAYHTWVGIGSADEESGKTGLAHLFEHLMFKGTDGYADGEYMARLDAMGVEGLNAWTWVDQTVYVQAVPKEALPDLVALEATRFDGLVIDEETFEKEREVVINERRLRVDNSPEGKLDEMVMAEAFKTHTYGWPTVGFMKDLEVVTHADAEAFYRAAYAPDNATIVVVGDVTPEEVHALVVANYGDMAPSGIVRAERPVEAEQTEARRVSGIFPMSSDLVQVVFKTPEYTHEDIPALLVLDAALVGGQSGRLQRALRDTGFASSVGGFVMPFRDPGLYTLSFKATPGSSADQVEDVFWKELERFRAEGPSEGEVEMGKAQWRADTMSELEEAAGKASFLGWSTTHTGNHLDGLARVEAIEAVTAEDVQRVAQKYLVPERSTVGVLTPEDSDEPVVLDVDTVTPAQMVAVSARDTVGAPEGWERGEVKERTVEGATLLQVWDATVPLVHFKLRFPTGAAADPAQKEGLAYVASKMLLRGTEAWDRSSFEGALEQLGASVDISVSAEATTLSGTALAESWPEVMTLVTSALTEPAVDEAQLDQLRDEIKNELTSQRDDDGVLAAIAARQFLYGDEHPYGRDVRGTESSLDAITAEDVRAFLKDYLRSEGALVGLAGAFDARAGEDLEQLLGVLAGAPAKVVHIAEPVVPAERKVVLVDKPGRTQAQVRMMLHGLDQRGEDFPAFLLANDSFGVGFGGRLMKEVRVARGWSYFAYSFPQLRSDASAWTLSLAPGADDAVDAVELVLDMTRKAASEGFTADEIEQSRSARVMGAPFLVDTPMERLDLEFSKRTVGYDRVSVLDPMRSTTLEQANSAFSKSVDPEKLIIAIVGTADDLKAGLEEKLGPVKVVSYTDL